MQIAAPSASVSRRWLLLAVLVASICINYVDRGSVSVAAKGIADELRLNLSIALNAHPDRMGVLAGDTAGFPNGRRLGDDIVDIEEQAVAGFLKGKKVPLGDGVNADADGYLAHFPYVMTPHQGYANEKATS